MMIFKDNRTNISADQALVQNFKSAIIFFGKKGEPYIKNVEVWDKGVKIWEGNDGEFFALFIGNQNIKRLEDITCDSMWLLVKDNPKLFLQWAQDWHGDHKPGTDQYPCAVYDALQIDFIPELFMERVEYIFRAVKETEGDDWHESFQTFVKEGPFDDGTFDQIKEPGKFHAGGGVCYVPECGDSRYTYEDYLEIAKGNERLARMLFDLSDWQHPETILDEELREGTVIEDGDTYKVVEK